MLHFYLEIIHNTTILKFLEKELHKITLKVHVRVHLVPIDLERREGIICVTTN